MLTNFPSSPWKSAKRDSLPPSSPSSKSMTYDRYIGSKIASDVYDFLLKENKEKSPAKNLKPEFIEEDSANINQQLIKSRNKQNYKSLLESNIMNLENFKVNGIIDLPSSVLKFKKPYHLKKKETLLLDYGSSTPSLFNFKNPPLSILPPPIRPISPQAYKILDAPNLQDDFYLNLLDWGVHNQIGVGLENIVYTWNPNSQATGKIHEFEGEDLVAAVAFNTTNLFSVSSSSGQILLFDLLTSRQLFSISHHDSRVSCLSFCSTSPNLLAAGSRDKVISINDLRLKEKTIFSLKGHRQEVCGVKWSWDGAYLASGGNDNKVGIWDFKMFPKPLSLFSEHTAAVKALAWNPHRQNELTTGGGTNDKKIKFWNTYSSHSFKTVETDSQVCNMVYSMENEELVSTHGFLLNQIFVWRGKEMQKIATLSGHKQRIIYLGLSPKGEDIVTGAGDDTLRFWKVFEGKRKNEDGGKMGEGWEELR